MGKLMQAGPDKVEVIVLDRGRGPETLFKVTRYGFLLGNGYYATVEEVAAAGVDLAKLVEI